jgi:hypothetical protein
LARPIPVGIDLFLDIREQNGGILDFIKYYWWGIQVEEPARVVQSGHANIRWLQRNDGVLIPIEMLQQGGLPRLTRANQHNGRKLADRFLQNGFQAAGNVIWDHILSLCIFAIELQICIFLSILHRTFAINLFEEPYKYRFS